MYLKSRVDKILIEHKQVLIKDEENAYLVPYDKLIIATGARPVVPNIIGLKDKNNVWMYLKFR